MLERGGGQTSREAGNLESLSIVKGMFNRVVREDQWDWFTVSRQLGYPPRRVSRSIGHDLGLLRKAITISDDEEIVRTCTRLNGAGTSDFLSVFLGELNWSTESNCGWIYVLSTRELPDLLKIGMTTRDVVQRAREINGATGVAVPFGVRRCWHVVNPREAERAVHRRLMRYRVRDDREFFRISFKVAAECIDAAINEGCFERKILSFDGTLVQRE